MPIIVEQGRRGERAIMLGDQDNTGHGSKLLGDYLRWFRVEVLGLSQDLAADLCGFTRAWLSSIECGRRQAGLNALDQIANGYDIELRTLLFLSGRLSHIGFGPPPPPHREIDQLFEEMVTDETYRLRWGALGVDDLEYFSAGARLRVLLWVSALLDELSAEDRQFYEAHPEVYDLRTRLSGCAPLQVFRSKREAIVADASAVDEWSGPSPSTPDR